MGNSSFVESKDMSDSILKILVSGSFLHMVKILIFGNQKRPNSAYEKARIAHESSLKSSAFAFLGGLTSFQNFMI